MIRRAGLFVFSALVAPAASYGQSAPEPRIASEEDATTDILVTARKRSERLIDVPAAATVLDGATIADRGGATTPVELLGGQPSVRILDTGSAMTNEISLRGSPTTRGTSGDPSVGLFRDGAYIGGGGFSGRSFARIDMFDVGRVEVLRGTQGALYGRNAVGGAVNIVSARPEFENSGFATLRYAVGNEQLQVQSAVNSMLSDEVAIRLGVDYVRQDGGFFYNDFLDKYFDRNDSTGVRGQLRWKHDDTDIVVRGEHWRGIVPAISFRAYIDPPRAGFPVGYIQPERTYPWSTDAFSRQEVNSGLLDVTHRFGFAQLRSITQYRQRKADYALDLDGLNPVLLAKLRANGTITAAVDPGQAQLRNEDAQFFTQDLNLAGDTMDGRLNWLAGVEYFQLRANSEQRVLRTPTVANASPGNRQPLRTTFDSWAVYGSLDYALNDQFNLIGEVRQTWDDKSATSRRYDLATGLPSGGAGFVVDFSKATRNFSYNGTLSWRPRDAMTVYAKVGSSYRAGGFNQDLGPTTQPIPIPAAYDDEQSTSIEAGVKGRLGRATTFGVAAYQTYSSDIIVPLNNGCFIGSTVCSSQPVTFSTNAGKARTWGAEAEIASRIDLGAGNLDLSGSGSYQKGRVTSGPFDGQLLPQIPRWTFAANATLNIPLSDKVDGLANLNYNGQRGGVHDLVAPGAPAPFNMDKIDLVNARIALKFSGIEAGLFATNLFDTTYDVFRAAGSRRLNPPRNWGFQLGYRW